VLAAVAIGHYFEVENNSIKQGLENYVPQNNRSQLTITESNKLVVDAYNANPTSLRAAILNFAQMDIENKTLIIGDMLELGEQSKVEHQNKFHNVLLVGKEFSETMNSFHCFVDVTELLKHIEKQPIKNHFVLIKGSRGIKLEKVISAL
jgi:UDP-N-acetylmuramoyl-tripeptide--D-alanyl-D-alanine ligase